MKRFFQSFLTVIFIYVLFFENSLVMSSHSTCIVNFFAVETKIGSLMSKKIDFSCIELKDISIFFNSISNTFPIHHSEKKVIKYIYEIYFHKIKNSVISTRLFIRFVFVVVVFAVFPSHSLIFFIQVWFVTK